jgi:nucleotide-binding universal stress UspA family protein
MIRTVSMVVTDERRDGPALAAAAAIAAREGAHLDVACLGVEAMGLDAMPMGVTPILLEASLREAREQAERLAAWARPRLAGQRVTVEPATVHSLGLPSAVAWRARLSDLAVAAAPGESRGFGLALVEGLLFGSGAPVLLVPERSATDWSRPFGRVVVAWNEGDEALAAVRGALPFLRAAEAVDVVVVDPPAQDGRRAGPGEDLAVFLVRHGVRAEVSVLARTLPRVSDVLRRFAAERGAEAVVMGAYGHSRLREAVLGGTTREMLLDPPLPLVMGR